MVKIHSVLLFTYYLNPSFPQTIWHPVVKCLPGLSCPQNGQSFFFRVFFFVVSFFCFSLSVLFGRWWLWQCCACPYLHLHGSSLVLWNRWIKLIKWLWQQFWSRSFLTWRQKNKRKKKEKKKVWDVCAGFEWLIPSDLPSHPDYTSTKQLHSACKPLYIITH